MFRSNISLLTRCLVSLTLCVLISSPGTASAEESEFAVDCLECHDDIWDDEIAKNFIHKPFLEKDCLVCHSPNSRLLSDGESFPLALNPTDSSSATLILVSSISTLGMMFVTEICSKAV